MRHEKECIRQAEQLEVLEKRDEHRHVLRKERINGTVERKFKGQMDMLHKRRTDNAFANQSGLDELHNRGLDITEDYNCKVKNWERATPRALKCPSFKEPDLKPRLVKTPDKPVRAIVPADVLTQEEETALAGLGSFADGLAVSPAVPKRASHGAGHFHVPRKSLMNWLLTEDPTRPPPAPVPPGGRHDHQSRVIIQSCFPPEYSPSGTFV
jgi:hypothetical protein